ncbi:hypothetical protein TYRP_022101 [Tyrophagus putrescentiae]|nr:hypothetical protein TYRP_022101 [Tyrophagus putrescentiae]
MGTGAGVGPVERREARAQGTGHGARGTGHGTARHGTARLRAGDDGRALGSRSTEPLNACLLNALVLEY